MESATSLSDYISFRRKFYEKLDAIRLQVDKILVRFEEEPPTLTDLARLEAFHLEKAEMFRRFTEVEDRLISTYLRERRKAVIPDESDGDRRE